MGAAARFAGAFPVPPQRPAPSAQTVIGPIFLPAWLVRCAQGRSAAPIPATSAGQPLT